LTDTLGKFETVFPPAKVSTPDPVCGISEIRPTPTPTRDEILPTPFDAKFSVSSGAGAPAQSQELEKGVQGVPQVLGPDFSGSPKF